MGRFGGAGMFEVGSPRLCSDTGHLGGIGRLLFGAGSSIDMGDVELGSDRGCDKHSRYRQPRPQAPSQR